MAGRAGAVRKARVPSSGDIAPMFQELDALEPKVGFYRNRIAKKQAPAAYINEEAKPGTKKVNKSEVSLNYKQQDHDFRTWLGQESIKDREKKLKKERKARAVKVDDWLEF